MSDDLTESDEYDVTRFRYPRTRPSQSLRARRSAYARAHAEWQRSEHGRRHIQLTQERLLEADRLKNLARELAKRNNLSEEVESDVRTSLLKTAEEARDIYSTVLELQSSERVGMRLVWATWGLAFFTAALVAATIVLIVVTAKVH